MQAGRGLYGRLLVIISFSVIIPILLITVGSLYVIKGDVVSRTMDDEMRQTSFQARFIEAWLLDPVITTMRLSEDGRLSEDLSRVEEPDSRMRLQDFLRDFLDGEPNIRAIGFLDVRGEVVLALSREGSMETRKDFGLEGLPVFSSAMSNTYPVTVMQVQRPGLTRTELGYLREVRNSMGHITHRLILVYALDVLADLPASAGGIWLLDEAGNVLDRAGQPSLPVATETFLLEQFPLALRREADIGLFPYGDRHFMVASSRITIPSVGGDHLILLRALPESAYLQGFYSLGLMVAAGALVLILLTAVIYSVLIRRATRPLKDLATAAENISTLDWEATRHLKVAADDEIGLLTKRFISMSQQLSQAFSRLTRLNSRLIVTLRSIVDGVIVTDPEETVSLLNSAAEQLTGWAMPGARGIPIHDILPREFDRPLQFTSRTGESFWLIIRRAEMWSVENEFLGSVYTLRDTTKERDYLDQLITARDMAESANQTKSDFLGIMSHELRTPLNPIIALCSLMLSERKLDEEHLDLIGKIYDAAQHQLELIQEILDYCVLESGEEDLRTHQEHLASFIDGVTAWIRPRAEAKGLLFEVQLDGNLPEHVQTDGRRLEKILKNLLGNALKFTEQGLVRLRVAASGPTLEFFVEDTGIGIDAGKAENIFEPFTQADSGNARRYGGTGLGLTISRELARLLGGQLDYVRPEGKGSIFRLMIPCGSPRAAASKETAVNGHHRSLEGLRCLLVEDDIPSQQAIRILLRSTGSTCDIVDTAEEALSRLQDNRFDVLLVDIHLPGMSGREFARCVRSQFAEEECPCLIAETAHAETGSIDGMLASGFDDVLIKPITLNSLRRSLEAHVPGKPEGTSNDA